MASPLHSDLTGVREPDTETETVDTLDSQNTTAREQASLEPFFLKRFLQLQSQKP